MKLLGGGKRMHIWCENKEFSLTFREKVKKVGAKLCAPWLS